MLCCFVFNLILVGNINMVKGPKSGPLTPATTKADKKAREGQH